MSIRKPVSPEAIFGITLVGTWLALLYCAGSGTSALACVSTDCKFGCISYEQFCTQVSGTKYGWHSSKKWVGCPLVLHCTTLTPGGNPGGNDKLSITKWSDCDSHCPLDLAVDPHCTTASQAQKKLQLAKFNYDKWPLKCIE